MYESMKIVYRIGNEDENSYQKSFNIEIASPDKDDFYYQLLSNFKEAERKYGLSNIDISYVETR